MSSESEDEDQLRSNYFKLRDFFDDDCTKLLRKVLNGYFPIYTDLLKKIPQDGKNAERTNFNFTEGELEMIKKETNISKIFKFELIDKIFRTGVCDEFCGSPSVDWNSHGETPLSNYQNSGDGFLQLFNIWRQYIEQNDQEEISDSDSKIVWTILREVTHHLKHSFPDFEKRVLKKEPIDESEKTTVNTQIGSSNSIKLVSSENSTETIVSNQIGQTNIFSSQNLVQRAPKTFICNQMGYECKIAITLDDQTRGRVNLGIEGRGELRLTLHSSQPCFEEIADRVANLSVEEINKDRCLQENCIEIVSTENACVIVDVRITNSKVDVSASMEYLVKCLMKHSDAFRLLCDNEVAVLNLFGYYYQPYEYIDSSDLRLKFSMFGHVTLKFEKVICDVDTFVSECLKKLIENSFKTNVDEQIRMRIKGKIIEPKSTEFTDVLKSVIDHEKNLKSMDKSSDSKCRLCHLQIEDKIRQKSAIDVLVKTTASFTYGSLLENDGPIVDLLRKIFQLDAVAEILSNTLHYRICVLVNTSMDEEFSTDTKRGIVYRLSSGSEIFEVIENNKLPEVINAMLGIKNTKDIEQLKVKAVLEYNNGKTDECGTSFLEENTTYTELSGSSVESKHLLDEKVFLGNFHQVTQKDQAVPHGFKDFQMLQYSRGTKVIAEDQGTDVDVTHDVFLIHANEPKEDKEFALLKLKPLLESRNLNVLVDEEDFQGGEHYFSNIARAVRRCRKSLIVLTEHSRESPWCSLELLLALEKSHRRNIMSVIVVRKGKSVEQQLVLDMLNDVPHVDIQNDDDIEEKLDELVFYIKERKQIEELLPVGNIADALVWSHYFGLLQYILPELAALVERTEVYKRTPTRFSTKLYELLPENCKCPQVIEDIPKDSPEKRIIVMREKLPNFGYTRSGNKRNVQMTIYCVKDTDGTEYYCVAEYPAVIAEIQKMIEETSSKLRECDRRTQVGRFYYTLGALLQHESLEGTLNKANIILYNENKPGFVLADVLIKAIKKDLHVGSIKEERIEKPLDRLSSRKPEVVQHDAFLFYVDENHEIGTEIYNYLESKGVKILIEDQRAGQKAISDLDYVIRNCYWTIVILTKKALKDRTFTLQLFCLLESFLVDKKIRLIPVLIDTRYGDIPDAIRVVTYVCVDENKKYLERLFCILKGKEIPFDRNTLIPAENVAYVLAWTYALNYLAYVLQGIGDSFIRALEKHNKGSSIYKEKVYILVPFSCGCKAKLSDADDSISYLDTIHPVYVDHSGNSRKYSFDMYTFFDKNKEYVFVGQFAAAITCLDDMWRVRIAGLSEADKIKQTRIFCHEIQNVLDQKLIEYAHYCEIVSYDDRTYSLSEEMKRRLKHMP